MKLPKVQEESCLVTQTVILLPHVQKQKGVHVQDCGLFAIAFIPYYSYGNSPEHLIANHFELLHTHLMLVLNRSMSQNFHL